MFNYPAFKKKLEQAKCLLYLGDNAGEIVFDKILLETILDRYDIESILFVVKGSPILNDATVEDGEDIGIDELPGVEMVEMENGMPNQRMKRIRKQFREIAKSVDLVISKGQGNYEAFSEHGGMFFLLMAKCSVIAGDLGVKVGDIVLKEADNDGSISSDQGGG